MNWNDDAVKLEERGPSVGSNVLASGGTQQNPDNGVGTGADTSNDPDDGTGTPEDPGSGGSAAAVGGGSQVVAGGNQGSGGNDPVAGGSSGGTNSGGGGSNGTGGEVALGGSSGVEVCPSSGDIQYVLNAPETWPQGIELLITEAMDEAVYYYNCHAELSQRLTVGYRAEVATVEANIDGVVTFGQNQKYMVTSIAMHSVGTTMGVGYAPWDELLDNGRWIGAAASAIIESLPASERDPDEYSQRTYLTADAANFWPYGLNYVSDHQSEWSLINHVRIVAAMQEDKAAVMR